MLTDVPVNAMMLASIVDGRCYVASQPDTQIQQVATIDRKTEAVSLLPLANKVDCEYGPREGGSVAEWLACLTQAQKGLGSNRIRDAVG